MMAIRASEHKPIRLTGRREQQRFYDQHNRNRESKAFYNSARWQRVRDSKLRQNPLCEDCQLFGTLEAATQVHHIKPLAQHPELACDIDNLRALCGPCHGRLEARERRTNAR